MEDRLLDVNEASATLGLNPSTLYQGAYERRIPVVKLAQVPSVGWSRATG